MSVPSVNHGSWITLSACMGLRVEPRIDGNLVETPRCRFNGMVFVVRRSVMKESSQANPRVNELPPIVSLRDREHVLALEFARAAKNFSARKAAKGA